MSTHQPTALRIDHPRSRARRRNNTLLIGGGVGLITLGLAAGLMWRAPAGSHTGLQGGDLASVASASALEPTSAGLKGAAATAADAPLVTRRNGETARPAPTQAEYAPWSEPAPPAVRPPAAVKRQSAAVAAPPPAEPQPQVAPWRPIETRQPVNATPTVSEAPRDAGQPPLPADPGADVVAAVTGETTPRERPRSLGCRSCGVVQSVRPVQLAGAPSGLGAIAGGVVGGLLGNQVGGGNGRQAMTVIGAAGGGLAGHEIEKRMRGQTVYDVQIRMDDGSTRTLRRPTAPAAGSRVRIEGDDLRPVAGDEPRFVRTGLVSR